MERKDSSNTAAVGSDRLEIIRQRIANGFYGQKELGDRMADHMAEVLVEELFR